VGGARVTEIPQLSTMLGPWKIEVWALAYASVVFRLDDNKFMASYQTSPSMSLECLEWRQWFWSVLAGFGDSPEILKGVSFIFSPRCRNHGS